MQCKCAISHNPGSSQSRVGWDSLQKQISMNISYWGYYGKFCSWKVKLDSVDRWVKQSTLKKFKMFDESLIRKTDLPH